MSSTTEQILDLKRQALALKDAGDTNGAMALLAQARDLEFENASVEDLWEPVQLKQFAVVMKKRGDLDTARQALIKAKQIEKDGLSPPQQPQKPEEPQDPTSQEQETTQDSMPQEQEEIQAPPASDPPEAKTSEEKDAPVEEPTPEDDTSKNEIERQSAADPTEENIPDEEEDGDMDELLQLDQQNDDTLVDVAFTIEEMADQDMMTEFRLGGMPTPSDEEYQAKILDCKKSALVAKKAGDTTKALHDLARSKQLEKVRVALSQLGGESELIGDAGEGWMDNLNAEESELLGELLPNNTLQQENYKEEPCDEKTKSERLEDVLEELAGFLDDPALFMDALDMGMEVPPLEEIESKAEEQKRLAVECKKAGNVEGAKAALVKCKQFTGYAQKLKAVREEVKRKRGFVSPDMDASEVKLEDLEAMLEADEKKSEKKAYQPAKEPVQKAEPAEKSSEQLREEAIRLRDQKKIKEAAEVLKLYKAALKREQEAAEIKRREELVAEIEKEIDLAQDQIKIFEYYQRFCDPDTQQIVFWKEYATRCENVSKLITAKGTASVNIVRKRTAMMVARLDGCEDQDLTTLITDLVAKDTNSDPLDERLEITVLSLNNLQENANLQKLLKKQKRENLPDHPSTVRLEVHLQLPPNEHDTEKAIELVFEPTSVDPLKKLELSSQDEGQHHKTCIFETSQFVDLIRGNTPYGKIIRKRVERNKKIQIYAYHVPLAEKRGWLFSKKNKEDLPPPTLLGKVVVEMHGLMTKRCIAAGEYPLMNGSGSKELGGSLRLAVRTGVPLAVPGDAADDKEGIPVSAELGHYTAMVFSLNKEEPGPAAKC